MRLAEFVLHGFCQAASVAVMRSGVLASNHGADPFGAMQRRIDRTTREVDRFVDGPAWDAVQRLEGLP